MAYGLIPVRVPGGHPTPNCFSDYKIADGYTTALLRGDVVTLVAGGTIERAAAGNVVLGVFDGVEYTKGNGEIVFDAYWPASQAILSGSSAKAYVYDDPNTVFKAQSDQDTTAFAAADEGLLCDIVVAAGNTTIKSSGSSIDSSTKKTTDGQFKFLNSAQTDGSFTAAGTTMDVYVLPNEHLYKAAVAGI